MKFKNEVYYTLTTTDFIGKAFNQLPVNAFIDKGRCAIGGTTIETDDKTRSTIMVVSTKGIIENKTIVEKSDDAKEIARKKSIFPVTKDTSEQEILDYLKLPMVGKKIMVIPDNFKKIIKVATKHNLLKELYREYFLLIDEAHSMVTEDYREFITIPFDYFWEFDNKSVISATPFYFSDPRFQEMDLHKIRFKNPDVEETYIDKMMVIEAKNPYATLHRIIATTEGNLHIFLNSVTEMTKIIEHGKLESCHVYCNGKEENIAKLGLHNNCFKPQPTTGEYAKVNCYTAKYFEGWDLKDNNATLILLTNVHQAHTKVGISNKGVQALGRIRTKDHQLIHITNHRKIKRMKTLDEIQKEYLLRASKQVEKYNEILVDYKVAGLMPTEEEQSLIKNYANIDEETQYATLKPIKVDQIINRQACDEQFNDISFIKNAWEDAGFEVVHQRSSLSMDTKAVTKEKRQSKAKKFEAVADRIMALYKEKEDLFNTADITLHSLKEEYPFAFTAYEVLGYEMLKELKFNEKAINRKLIEVRNINAESKLLKLLKETFSVHRSYTKEFIKGKLQELYAFVGIERTATAEQLGEDGRFEIHPCKVKNKDGKQIHGFTILRSQFEMKVAA